MFLAPQHFQAQRRHFEESLGHTIDALFPFGYGVTSAALDADALGGGMLALSHARGIFPDGTPVAVPEADIAPPVASWADRFSPARDSYVVLLTLPAWRSEAANVAPGTGGRRPVVPPRRIAVRCQWLRAGSLRRDGRCGP
jgi:type VI secretion system protein ImpJ